MENKYPKKLYIEVTTRCNLSCTKCVKYAKGSSILEGDMSKATFKRLLPAIKQAQFIVLNGIGEPLLHPELVHFIQLSREVMSQKGLIGFQSNGVLMNSELAFRVLDAGLDTICLSVDGLLPSLFTKEHSLSHVQRAAVILDKARRKHKEHFKIGAEVVLKRDTVRQLPGLVSWAVEQGIDYIIATHLIQYDIDHKTECIFDPNPAGATKIFQKYMEMARSEGVDLADEYYEYRRYVGTRTNPLVLKIFADMQKEAKKEDIRLNLERLFQSHTVHDDTNEEYILEALDVAKKHHVQLDLPFLQGQDQEDRSCPFIEQEAAFITMNGDVMPCHFLWHTYECQVNDEPIHVREKNLGSVTSQSIESIWQKKEYKDFRDEARGAKYSSCWSCPLAPCPTLVNDNESDGHDCFGSRVPCGHCHWNLGGFQCL